MLVDMKAFMMKRLTLFDGGNATILDDRGKGKGVLINAHVYVKL